MSRTVLITGGAGFIGSNFTRLLLSETDMRGVVLDKLTYAGNLASLADLAQDERFVFVRGDIADTDNVRNVFLDFEPDWVVNFAAESHVDRSIDGPRTFLETNVTGCFELLEASRVYLTAQPSRAAGYRFLHVSTDEVYGSLGKDGAFHEESPYAPNSPYSASKAAADHFVRAYRETYGVPTLLTNCSNNYGPYQFPEKLIPLVLLNAIDGKSLPIYGDGGNVRDWLHVEDHCRAILHVLGAGVPGQKYNVGARSERTNLQIVDAICAALEEELPAAENLNLAARKIPSYQALKTFVKDRPGHDRRYAVDPSKIERELGWQPLHDFHSGIRATVRWYLDHRDWCAEVQSGQYQRERLGLAAESVPG